MVEFETIALILCGGLGAGKSHAARYIEEKYGFLHLSFVDKIWKPILQERSLAFNRENLQQLGIELITTLGPEALVDQLLASEELPSRIVIDDVRRKDVAEIIRSKTRSTMVAYIESSLDSRFPRLVIRDGVVSKDQQVEVEQVATETTIPELRSIADIIILNEGGVEGFEKQLDQLAERVCKLQ